MERDTLRVGCRIHLLSGLRYYLAWRGEVIVHETEEISSAFKGQLLARFVPWSLI